MQYMCFAKRCICSDVLKYWTAVVPQQFTPQPLLNYLGFILALADWWGMGMGGSIKVLNGTVYSHQTPPGVMDQN